MAAIFLVFMTSAPVLIRLMERAELFGAARIIAYAGYFWMAALFLFFSLSIAIDIYRAAIFIGGKIAGKGLSGYALSSRNAFFIPAVCSIIFVFYGYFEAKTVRIEKVEIKTDKIPKSAGKITIAQITDVHLGLIIREERLKNILRKLKEINPDILVSTGDLVDGQSNDISYLADFFNEIKPRYGKYAVMGNHEFYVGIERALDFTKKAGFVVLREEAVDVAGVMNIAGVDDPVAKNHGIFKNVSEKELLSRISAEKFTLLLKHRPVIDEEALGLFDLQLSGHTHRGQIFPFYFISRVAFPMNSGLYVLNDEGSSGKGQGKTIKSERLMSHALVPQRVSRLTYLYVSRGSGTWGPPVRFLSPPEVTVIELINSEKP